MVLTSNSWQSATALSIATVITVTAFNAPPLLAQIPRRGNFTSTNSPSGWPEEPLLRTIPLGPSGSSVLSADGQTLANGSWNSTLNNWTIQVWNPTTGELKRTLVGSDQRQPNPGQPIAISADGQILISTWGSLKVSDPTLTLKVWNMETGQLIRSFGPLKMSRVALSPDGQTLAVSSEFGEAKIFLWDIQTGKLSRTLDGNADWVPLMLFSPDGQTLLSNVYDKDLLKSQIWDLKTGDQIRPIPTYSDSLSGLVYSLAYSKDGHMVARSGAEGTVKIWNLRTGQLIQTINNPPIGVSSIAFSPNGQTLATGSPDQRVKLWDLRTGQLLRILHAHSTKVDSVTFSADGQTLVSKGMDAMGGVNTVKLWNVTPLSRKAWESEELLRTLTGNSSAVLSIALSPDGQILASRHSDNTLKVRNLLSGEVLHTFNLGTSPVKSIAFSPDWKMVATGSEDRTIHIWNLLSGELIRTLTGHVGSVESIAFSPDGQTLVSGSGFEARVMNAELSTGSVQVSSASPNPQCNGCGDVKFWDLNTGQLLRTLTENLTEPPRAIAISPDGQTVAIASNYIQLRSLKTGQLLRTLVNPDSRDPLKLSRPRAIAFSADGQKLASGDFNGTIQLWNLTGRLLRTLPGHYSRGISAVSFSPDGETLASISGASETIQLWNLGTGDRWRDLVGHEYAVTAVAFAPDGQTLISGSADKTVKFWQLSP
jgi:WD40 repeat protein